MKTALCLLLLAAGSALAQEPQRYKPPVLLDAPGPGYRREPLIGETLNLVSPALRRPAVSMLQATTIADREMQTRGLAEDFILRSVTFVRGARNDDSFYLALLTPLDSTTTQTRRELRIDMRGGVTFREGEAERK